MAVRGGRQDVFTSVFPITALHAPRHTERFEKDAKPVARECETALLDGSREALGIYDEGREYGHLPGEAAGYRFRGHYASCPRLADVPELVEANIESERAKLSRLKLWSKLPRWQRQLGGDQIRKTLAAVLDRLLTDYVHWAYAGVYEDESEVIPHLKYWVGQIFSRYVVHVLTAIRQAEGIAPGRERPETSSDDVKKWEEMAMTRLGILRVNELFDIVVDWDTTQSGIDDLKHYTTNPATRSYVTSNFITVLTNRLLHPGASTIEILQLYISIIRAFQKLDPKGVLLDRVARQVRRYLRDRDDTVQVIVTGLLSDAIDEHGDPSSDDPNVLTELARELNNRDDDEQDKDNELDWDNMEWMPEPIDAASDHVKAKNTNVIGSLISLFESKDIFVRELQSSLAERLLKNKRDFDQEIEVLEHLKLRFGGSSLQSCEVMLRDVLDSRKVDNVIRLDQGMQDVAGQPTEHDMVLHTKILSRLFWPSLQDQAFKIPVPILEQQARYEKGFEALKQSRKLTWLNALGQVEVELDLEDRVFQDEVLPWQAAVIYAFQDERQIAPVTKTVADLAAELDMSPTLVRSACIFWLSKRILTQSPSNADTFTVLETLPEGSDPATRSDGPVAANTAAVAAAEAGAAQAAKEAEEAERQSKMAIYSQFVISLLTNQGAMPLPRIAMMLNMVVPGGFPFSNEELKEFLAVLVRDGKLEVGHGGVYKALS